MNEIIHKHENDLIQECPICKNRLSIFYNVNITNFLSYSILDLSIVLL